ncbi:hypothetical protein NAC44_01815 [Allorhizobium sp. BGMRC 0089]|uniref:hypothetical protein n=1 Tax=Allorhizobium sonneratiae TaxID=2934936 RepID=UPI0020341EBF|nr:hypothetical protein [Allorhizobium sonneratiae]MCM2291064.1 hypothetical protein [Allorhizobium sonneratiae]
MTKSIIQTAPQNSHRGGMFGFSVESVNDWSNRIYLFATIFSIVFAAIALLSSYFMWRSSTEISAAKDRALAAYQADSNVRAAKLEKEAREAQLETEKIKASVSWRIFSKAESSALVTALRKASGPVNLRYMDGDPESLYLAIQLSQILALAGWSVAPGSMKPGNAIPFGIWIPQSGPLAEAFVAANIPFTLKPLPQQQTGNQFNVQMIPNAPFLFVGPRQPAAFQ